MKIDLKDINLIFEKMQEELNISYVSIVIFAAVDLDSLCTLKIFSVPQISPRKCSSARISSTKSTQSPPTPS